ncbi:MAG: EAL domain-containing protein [Hyphomicrobiaceae bacterium]|nr:EAL domain-containing protein [Hyphomicrobiaceae bacterium]
MSLSAEIAPALAGLFGRLSPSRLTLSRLIVVALVAVLAASAIYVSYLVFERQERLNRSSQLNLSWIASQAAIELYRLDWKLAAYSGGHLVEPDELQMRMDILVNRVGVMRSPDFQRFLTEDAERMAIFKEFADLVAEVDPIVSDVNLDRIEAMEIAQKLNPIGPKLGQLASIANSLATARVGEDQAELVRLYWVSTGILLALITLTGTLVIATGRNNRSLRMMHSDMAVLTDDLKLKSQQMKVQNTRFDAAINNMSQGLGMYDGDYKLVVSNDRYAEMYGLPVDLREPGTPFDAILRNTVAVGLSDWSSVEKAINYRYKTRNENAPTSFVLEMANGRFYQVNERPMPDGGWVATHEDITERLEAESRISYLARHDALTGLSNRTVFRERVEAALERVRRERMPMAVLCFDLDRFKHINDTLGHSFGDQLLVEVAARFRACVTDIDVLARLGGDEFAIVLIGDERAHQAARVAEKTIAALSVPFNLGGHLSSISVSVGIALAPDHGTDAEVLLRNADMALYEAKANGRACFRFFDPEMDNALKARRALETDLCEALGNGELSLRFQPLVDLRSGRIKGAETLLRWHHPHRGWVSPAEFIPIAEENGLILPIGEWVLREACFEAMHWPKDVMVAVNLSPMQFRAPNLVAIVHDALAKAGLEPSRLELEITESVLLDENDSALRTIKALREFGVRISLDDFGTGYSSLSYLRRFPIDKIKLDQSFVRDMAVNPDCVTIVHAIASLGSALRMTTTAEGVETAEQLAVIRLAGYSQAQGWFFGKPMESADIRKTIGTGFDLNALRKVG